MLYSAIISLIKYKWEGLTLTLQAQFDTGETLAAEQPKHGEAIEGLLAQVHMSCTHIISVICLLL